MKVKRMGLRRILRKIRPRPEAESFFLCISESANGFTIKASLIEQFENLRHCGDVVVQLKEHDRLGSLVRQIDTHSRTPQSMNGTD
jgi:hypothetical protein